ncbi:ring-opening amidohydrolase [Pararobbsia silviterrae]|uniref:Cyclic amide hydrolase n=1 Tax=Pararobbsia silviterrae TaxID=1792498 RepID=A0A494XA37_9BURK|nr:ring-opening amidohydrolase [Pararobbsia silviterrae]RKP44989.1 ring-opening amidohydrolase [Pararobbsia silviterrae]
MKIHLHRIAMMSPGDTSGLAALIERGEVDPSTIVAVIGKTEGNGGANDFTRGFATQSFQLLIAARLGVSPEQVASRICFVWSGGTEGVLSPHATVFTRVEEPIGEASSSTAESADAGRLTLGVATTRDLLPEEVGTTTQVELVAHAVHEAMREARIDDPRDVHYVQVKGPLLTPALIADADRRGKTLVTRDANGSKPYARGATALGVAVGLGEVERAAVTDDVIAKRMDLYSSVASTSAGGELRHCEVLLFGNSAAASSAFSIRHGVLNDVVDAASIRVLLGDAPAQGAVAAMFAKADASPDGRIRGWRTTMLTDADIHYERHARAALGAVITSIAGDPAIFVSGGTEHQCAPGQMPIAAIIRH